VVIYHAAACVLGTDDYNYYSTAIRLSFDCDSISIRPRDVHQRSSHAYPCARAAAPRPK